MSLKTFSLVALGFLLGLIPGFIVGNFSRSILPDSIVKAQMDHVSSVDKGCQVTGNTIYNSNGPAISANGCTTTAK